MVIQSLICTSFWESLKQLSRLPKASYNIAIIGNAGIKNEEVMTAFTGGDRSH